MTVIRALRIFLYGAVSILTGCASTSHRESDMNTVATLGSLHARMLRNKIYSLNDFAAAIDSFKPDIILTEVRPAFPGPIEGSIDGGIEQSLVYAIAEESGAEVRPVDWFDDELISRMEREGRGLNPHQVSQIELLQKKYVETIETGSIFQLNSQQVQNQVRELYAMYESFHLSASKSRNEKICLNIQKELRTIRGKRVLIIFGLDHKFYIEDCVSEDDQAKISSMSEWFNMDQRNAFTMNTAIKNRTVENMKAAEKLLRIRVRSNFYSNDLKPRLAKKLESFGDWIEVISGL